MMSLDAFGNIGGRLGSIGVVLSPVHPVIEVERNTEAERASTTCSIATSIAVTRSIAKPRGDASR